jgi:pimeloyl-ACP methyl ester carboxylesterase
MVNKIRCILKIGYHLCLLVNAFTNRPSGRFFLVPNKAKIVNMKDLQVIALHGAGMNGRAFAPMSACLPFETMDLPGHGDGALPLGSVAAMAKWVMERLTRPCVLIGHSMGALAAMEAAGHPQVSGLILMGAAAAMPVHSDLLRQAREAPETAAELVLKWGIFSRDGALKDGLRVAMTPALGALGVDMAACNDYKLLKRIDKPALVLAGAEDKMVPPVASEELTKFFQKVEFRILPATGHMMMAENPPACCAAASQFIKQIQ